MYGTRNIRKTFKELALKDQLQKSIKYKFDLPCKNQHGESVLYIGSRIWVT